MPSNVELVRMVMNALFNEQDISALARHYSSNFIQHNPGAPGGHAAVAAGVSMLSPGVHYEIGMIAAERDIVMVHGRYINLPATGYTPDGQLGSAAPPIVGVDIFRIEDGKIAEHWDVLQPEVPVEKTVSGHRMFQTKSPKPS